MTVLIVDDEVPLLKNLSGYLNSLGDRFRVLTATSAEEGLEILEGGEDDIRVLVTDVRLPGMDGIELVRRVKDQDPALPVVVMSAYGTATVKRKAHAEGALTFLEKPVDLEEFAELLTGLLDAGPGPGDATASAAGEFFLGLVQLLSLSERPRAMSVSCKGRSGFLLLRDGQVVHASTDDLAGEEAFKEMATWEGITYEELDASLLLDEEQNVHSSIPELITMVTGEAPATITAQVGSSAGRGASSGATGTGTTGEAQAPPVTQNLNNEEERRMAIKDYLHEFNGIEGFKAVALFTAQGEMIESETVGKYDIKSAGMYANNALLNAQKATDQMGVGRGNLVQIRAPQANVLMRCFNEATDFAATKEGKAHFHVIVIMDPEGNMGMATMILDKIVGKIADELR